MTILVKVSGNDRVRLLSNGQNRSGQQISGTVTEENENLCAMRMRYLKPGLRKCHIRRSVFIKIPNGYLAFQVPFAQISSLFENKRTGAIPQIRGN